MYYLILFIKNEKIKMKYYFEIKVHRKKYNWICKFYKFSILLSILKDQTKTFENVFINKLKDYTFF